MSREDLHFRLRIPDAVKAQVANAAAASERSMTAEIVHRLRQSFDQKKRPGEAATSSEPVSRPNPCKEKPMNRESDNTGAPPPATEPKEDPCHLLAKSELKRLSMKQLDSLYDAVHLIAEVLLGIIQQPRFSRGDDPNVLCEAGELVDILLTHLQECRTAIVAAAIEAQPADPFQSESRAWLMLRRDADYKDGLPEFAAQAAALVSRQSAVEFHARRRVSA